MGSVRVLAASLALVLAAAVAEAPAHAECVDEVLKEKLALKRRRRGVVERNFIKVGRHELSLGGGYYVSDEFSATYLGIASYTYHLTEDAGVEAWFNYTRSDAPLARVLEDGRATLIKDTNSRTLLAGANLLWSPIHGKMMLFSSRIIHFDLGLTAGVGVVDSDTSRGAAANAGLALKLFLSRSWALRMDVRDQVYRQELLDHRTFVNDLSLGLGLSVFLPTRF